MNSLTKNWYFFTLFPLNFFTIICRRNKKNNEKEERGKKNEEDLHIHIYNFHNITTYEEGKCQRHKWIKRLKKIL